MRRFGPLDATALREALREAVVSRLTGSIIASGHGDGGQIWLRDGQVAYAQTDSQPRLGAVLSAIGLLDEEGMARLRETATMPPELRPVSAEVAAVVRELTDVALDRLLGLTEGSWRLSIGDAPPLGVLTTRSVDEALSAARTHRAVEAARSLQVRGQWRSVRQVSGKVKLQPREWELVAAMVSPASSAELSHRLGWPITQVRTVLAELDRQGLIERAGEAETAPSRAPATSEPMVASAPLASEPELFASPPAADAPTPEVRVREEAIPTEPLLPEPTADARPTPVQPASPVHPEPPVLPEPPARELPPAASLPPVAPPAVSPPAVRRTPSVHRVPEPTTSLPAVREPVGAGVASASGAGAWTANEEGGSVRAAALRRLIGAVRRM